MAVGLTERFKPHVGSRQVRGHGALRALLAASLTLATSCIEAPVAGAPQADAWAADVADGLGDAVVADAAPAAPEPDVAAPAPDPPAEPEPPPPNPCPRVRVVNTGGNVLNVRPDPSRAQSPVGVLQAGEMVEMVREVQGESIDGVSLWYEIRSPGTAGYVFSSFAQCTTDEPPADDGTYYVPFACGSQVRITQANGGTTSHTGRTQYAFDFGVGLNTPVLAMRSGRVSALRMDTQPGQACYNGGDSSCGPLANWVILEHGGGQTSAYKHLNSTTVRVGDAIARGAVVGLSGSTGYSTGPHLHLELRQGCATEIYCQTVALRFADVGVPASNTAVISGNCP